MLMTHGYLLSGTGSNIYVQNLARTFVRLGHTVFLLCQDREAAKLDFVDAFNQFSADNHDWVLPDKKTTPLAGHCTCLVPHINGLLPVYAHDPYPGFDVKTFPQCSDEGGDRDVRRMQPRSHRNATPAVRRRCRSNPSHHHVSVHRDFFDDKISAEQAEWVARIVKVAEQTRSARVNRSEVKLDGVMVEQVETLNVVEFGPEWVGMEAWRALGLTEKLQGLGLRRQGISTAEAMVINTERAQRTGLLLFGQYYPGEPDAIRNAF